MIVVARRVLQGEGLISTSSSGSGLGAAAVHTVDWLHFILTISYCWHKSIVLVVLPNLGRIPACLMCSIFSSLTSAGADAVIVGGDLNMHPQDLGTRLLRAYTGLRDAYLETSNFDVSTDLLFTTLLFRYCFL